MLVSYNVLQEEDIGMHAISLQRLIGRDDQCG